MTEKELRQDIRQQVKMAYLDGLRLGAENQPIIFTADVYQPYIDSIMQSVQDFNNGKVHGNASWKE